MSRLKTFYYLTKPGIIYGNALTTAGGLLLAARGRVTVAHLWLLLATIMGISLVVASACVFNNYIDRGIDDKMARTRRRGLVSGKVSGPQALVYGSVLGILGFGALTVWTNGAAVLAAAAGFFFYVVMYSIWKRKSVYGTAVGSISGAVPPVVGYLGVTGRFDVGAVLIFAIMVLWQMPHFFAIAMYRFDDYKAAGLPVWPVARGMRSTKIQIMLYIATFVIAVALLTVAGVTGYVFLVVMVGLGLGWLWMGVQGMRTSDDRVWARKMFLFSLLVITAFSVMMPLGALLP